MRDFAELNITEFGRPVTRAGATLADFLAFESEQRLVVPGELRQLLSFCNGGHPERDSIRSSTSHRDEHHSVNRFYHLSVDDRDAGSLWYAATHWRAILGTSSLPFASDGGGNQFFVDLRDGSVKLCLHDEQMTFVSVAASFESFIDGLDVDEEMI